MKQKRNLPLKRISLMLMCVCAMSLVIASGVSRPYWDENPLRLAPGEEMLVTLTLQNMVGGQDLTLKAELTGDGGGIATIIDESKEYAVPFGASDIPVNVLVQVPETDRVGGVRQISLFFEDVTPSGGGMVHVSSAFSTNFPVYVVVEEESELYIPTPSEEERSYIGFLLGAISAIVLIILVILISRPNKKKRR